MLLGGDDSLNILGGIGDALSTIAYEDDEQIIEIHYKYYLDLNKSDWYVVKLEYLDSTCDIFSEEEISQKRMNGL